MKTHPQRTPAALTVLAVDNVKPKSARFEMPDGKVGGLRLVVQPSGHKSWALRYTVHAAAGLKASATDLAVTFLEDALAGGPESAKAIRERGESSGHSWRTIRRAQHELGITPELRGFGKDGTWYWKLPDEFG